MFFIKMRKNEWGLWIVILILLAGCSGPDKKPLKGQRIPVMLTEQEIEPDPEIKKQPFTLPRPIHNQAWSQAGGNPTHAMPPVGLHASLKPLWSKSIGRGRLMCSPVIADEILFMLSTQGKVIALHTDTGKEVWSQSLAPQGFRDINLEGGGVAHSSQGLYVATGWGEIFCLNPKSGQTIWHHRLDTPIRSAPTVHDGRVFIVTTQNELWTFQDRSGDILWSHAGIPEVAFLEGAASPAVQSDLVVVAYSSGEAYALQPENGYPLWSDALNSPRAIDSMSSIAHIRAHPVIIGNTVLLVSHGGRTRAVDTLRGEKVWELNIGGIQTPAVFDAYAAFVTNDAHCVCVHIATGKVRWITPLVTSDNHYDVSAWSGPLWTSAGLLCLGSQGRMVWIDPESGILREGVKHRAPFTTVPPIVADDTLFTLDGRGVITAWK